MFQNTPQDLAPARASDRLRAPTCALALRSHIVCRLRPSEQKRRSTRIGISLALLASFCFLGATVSAQETGNDFAEMDLEQLMELRIDSVYGASKHEQRVTQAPSAISIITASEIKRFGHRTLVDVLRSVRGLYVSDDRNYTYVGIRGFHRPNDYNTRVLVLIDGHRINDNIFDSGTVGREGMIDVELIERVEVIRGPSSSIYGSSAFFGVINVVTKRPDPDMGIELSAEAGSYGTYKSRLTYGTKTQSGLEWLISGSHYTSEGPRSLYYPEFDQRISDDPRATNDGIARRLDGEEALNFFTSLRYQYWTLSAFASDRRKDIPTASFETVFNEDEWSDDERAYVDLKLDRPLSNTLRLQARAFYDRYIYSGDYPYDYSESGDPAEFVISKDATAGEWIGTEWQLTAQLAGGHRLTAGAEYRENFREEQYMYDDVEPRVYYTSYDNSSRTFGAYVQGEVALRDNLTLNTGVRFDHYAANSVDTLNPRLALIYSPTALTAVKVLYGEAFRAPNPYESFYNEGQQYQPPLDNETVDTYEVVFERYFGRNYRANVSGYYYEVNGLISQDITEDELIYFANIDGARARGLELELEGKFDSGTLVRGSFALQRAEDRVMGRELSSSPRQLGKLNVSLPIYKDRLSTGFELQYHGNVNALDGEEIDDFVLANITLLTHRVTKGLEIRASVYNAFDERYGYPGAEDHLQRAIQQNGRTVHATFTYRF